MSQTNPDRDPQAAARELDERFVEIVRWHFSADTGTPFWLDWMKQAGSAYAGAG